jgi:maltooligosyltrehalose synthase
VEGNYTPLHASSGYEKHVVSYARSAGGKHAIAAAPRLSFTLMKGVVQPPLGRAWDRAYMQIPPEISGEFRNVFTGDTLNVSSEQRLLCSEVFGAFPVALLISA